MKIIIKSILVVTLAIITFLTFLLAYLYYLFGTILTIIMVQLEKTFLRRLIPVFTIFLIIINYIVDAIFLIIIFSGYKIKEDQLTHYCESEDIEVRTLTNALLIENNIVLKILFNLLAKDKKEYRLGVVEMVKDINKEFSKSKIEKFNEYTDALHHGNYFTALVSVFLITIINLTILNTNYKWNH